MRKTPLWIRVFSIAVYAFLYVPLLIVILYSFNDSALNAEWVGFTLKWYNKLFNDDKMLVAARNSLLIGLVSSLFATVFGTMAGLVLHRFKAPVLQVLTITPIAIPEILTGISLLIFFSILNVASGFITITLAHIAFSIGFVAIVVRSRMAGMDEAFVEAARDLGASQWQAFRLITLPLIMPGVIAGALMAFTLSIDDFVITYFVSGPGSSTLPLSIYTMVRTSVTPEVNAISSLLMLLTLVIITAVAKLSPGLFKKS